MTDIERLDSAIYMIRNLLTGDDEQTRIGEEQYLGELPPALSHACEYFVEVDHDYAAAIWIYVHWQLRKVIPEFNFDAWIPELEASAKRVSLDLRGDPEDVSEEESEKEEQASWLEMAGQIFG